MYLVLTRFGMNCNKRYVLHIRSPLDWFQLPSKDWKQSSTNGKWKFRMTWNRENL
jgi:hypothetical protein